MPFFINPVTPPDTYHYRQPILGDLSGTAGECQFPEPVEPPRFNGELFFRVYVCPECGSVLHANGVNLDQPEPLVTVFVICGFCAYPDFVRDLPYPEDLCRCFGWVYLNDED